MGGRLTTPSVLPVNRGGIELNRSVTCMVLKATANDRRHLALCHDEFHGLPSGLCRPDNDPSITMGGGAFPFQTGIHFRRKTSFSPEEDTTMSYSGFESEPTRLQAESHNHHTGWATFYELNIKNA
ncbi:hypothetical protein TNCV_4883221 [Trichonephila clavipes]|nr:hypothetical protein TNCV_4883221 [Trichonephila clavipes]